MKRTRKWGFVAQEAGRLAALGLAPKDIAIKLGVNKSSVTRWMAAGRLKSTRGRTLRPPSSTAPPLRPPKTPDAWAQDIRRSYDLDATDDQLVAIAESALALTLNMAETPQIRLQAAGRFQAIVKQLALVARSGVDTKPTSLESQAAAKKPPVRRHAGDPRVLMMAVAK